MNSEKAGFVCAASTEIGNRYGNQWIDTRGKVESKTPKKDSHKSQK
jgi:hypothetical protein